MQHRLLYFCRSSCIFSLLLSHRRCFARPRSSSFVDVLHSSTIGRYSVVEQNRNFGRHSIVSASSVNNLDGIPIYPSVFLSKVEETVAKVLERFHDNPLSSSSLSSSSSSGKIENYTINILDLPAGEREALGVARRLDTRLKAFRRNNDCPRCWMQRAHCICKQCPPVGDIVGSRSRKLKRIFLLMHHKEVCLKVDTAKLLLASFPNQCRLVVGGIGSEYQESMLEMEEAMKADNCLVLFPDETARTFRQILEEDVMQKPEGTEKMPNTIITARANEEGSVEKEKNNGMSCGWDVIVIDGTWAQARKLYSRHVPVENGPRRVCLSERALFDLEYEPSADGSINRGHQLRRHDVAWRQVGTFEATRLLLKDMMLFQENGHSTPYEKRQFILWKQLEFYQSILNQAVRDELGPPRI